MQGEQLINNLAQATELPHNLVLKELKDQILAQGFDPKTISLDDLRLVLTDYLQEVILKAREQFSE